MDVNNSEAAIASIIQERPTRTKFNISFKKKLSTYCLIRGTPAEATLTLYSTF
jgi:hypothetical protein